jgi:hypothetical protein
MRQLANLGGVLVIGGGIFLLSIRFGGSIKRRFTDWLHDDFKKWHEVQQHLDVIDYQPAP